MFARFARVTSRSARGLPLIATVGLGTALAWSDRNAWCPAHLQSNSSKPLHQPLTRYSVADAAESIGQSVVQIRGSGTRGWFQVTQAGSGFAIEKQSNGHTLIITNAHVVGELEVRHKAFRLFNLIVVHSDCDHSPCRL